MSTKFMALLGKYSPYICGLLVFIIYIFTLAPTVIQIDSGELAAVQSTLGIAHPTGYPLFTTVGYLLLLIPLPFTKIYSANLLAAFWCSAGVVIFIKSLLLLLENNPLPVQSIKKTKTRKEQIVKVTNDNEKNIILISSLTGGLILGLSKTFWMQSTSVEVYSFQIFLFALIIFKTLKAYYDDKNKIMNWVFVAISFGLGFSNHMTSLLIIPFTAILFFTKEKFSISIFKKLGFLFSILILTTALFYLYLPLRASSNPILNWGNPINLENFLRHITGKQYQVWLFASIDAAKKQLGYYFQNLPAEFAYVGLVFFILGMFELYKCSKKIFWTIFVTLLLSIGYAVNYDIVDIDSYFLASYFMIALVVGFGVKFILKFIKQLKLSNNIILITAFIITIIPLIVNSSNVNQSDQYTFEDYTKALISSTEKSSVIFSYQWDYFISASYYFQQVENFRKDAVIIDKELLRRSWYYNQLKRNHPSVIKMLQADIDNFLDALRPFERDEIFDPAKLEMYYRTIMTKLISENYQERNFYIGFELIQNEMQRGEFNLPEGYQIVPHLFLFKVVKGNEYVPAPDPDFKIRFPKNPNKYNEFIYNAVATMLVYRANYEMQYNKKERAKIYLDKIQKDYPEYLIPPEILARIYN